MYKFSKTYTSCCKQDFKSSSGVLISLKSNVSTKYWSTLGLKNAGNVGPKYIPFIPNDNNANKSATAFCSYQDIIKDNGNPLTSVSKASASAVAILTAEYASLHWPTSNSLGSPATSPNSNLLNLYFPHASVSITQSFGTFLANSV